MDKKWLFLLHLLSNIEINEYFNYNPRFNGVFSRDKFPRIKDGAYFIKIDDKQVTGHIGFYYLLTEVRLCILILLN